MKDIVYQGKVENMNGLCERVLRVAECATNKIPYSTWQETLIFKHVVPLMVPILRSICHHKKLGNEQCLKIC